MLPKSFGQVQRILPDAAHGIHGHENTQWAALLQEIRHEASSVHEA
jgi:hypothetical protein